MSSKLLFVMDMPEHGCMDCDICRSSLFKTICGITGNGVSGNRERGGFPEDCPLKPMPEKNIKCEFKACSKGCCTVGWNACLDAVMASDDKKDKRIRL